MKDTADYDNFIFQKEISPARIHQDLDAIEKFTDATETGIGIKRHVKRRVFYVLKEPPEGARVLTADEDEQITEPSVKE